MPSPPNIERDEYGYLGKTYDPRLIVDKLDLQLIPPQLHERARDAFIQRNAVKLLGLAQNTEGMAITYDNMAWFRIAGIYEDALLHSYMATKVGFHDWALNTLLWMFEQADKAKLRACGDPLPPGETFTIYRGVAGVGRGRRVRGISWTTEKDVAQFFADRYGRLGYNLPDPAVYQATIAAADVWAYLHSDKGRGESEILCRPAKCKRVK